MFHDMPVAALGIAPAIAADLSRAGLKRIGDLALRPRSPIAARFGADSSPGSTSSAACAPLDLAALSAA